MTRERITVKTECTEQEYHEGSSDRCPNCGRIFYVNASGWDVPQGYDCPHCGEFTYSAKIRKYRQRLSELAAENIRLSDELRSVNK